MSEFVVQYIYPLTILILLYICILQEIKIKRIRRELNQIKLKLGAKNV